MPGEEPREYNLGELRVLLASYEDKIEVQNYLAVKKAFKELNEAMSL